MGHLARLDDRQGRGYISAMPRRTGKKDSPAKFTGRMKRRWRVVRLRANGEILGTVEAPDVATAKAAAVGPVWFVRYPAQPDHGAGTRLKAEQQRR
jgi:hypothetical protein